MSMEAIVSLASLFVAGLSIAKQMLDSKYQFVLEKDKAKEKTVARKEEQLQAKIKVLTDYVEFTSLVLNTNGSYGRTDQARQYGLVLLQISQIKSQEIRKLQQDINDRKWDMAKQEFQSALDEILVAIQRVKQNDDQANNSN